MDDRPGPIFGDWVERSQIIGSPLLLFIDWRRHERGQNREATELGNQTRIDRSSRGEYRYGTRMEKKKILDEFIEVTGFHRKHAIRALRKACSAKSGVLQKF